ncbi:MAG: hypothetical protein CI948_2139, partial [Halanaerobium sp.]
IEESISYLRSKDLRVEVLEDV